jgi:hypothetical protein
MFGIVFGQVGDGRVRPGVVERHGERAHEHRVLPLSTHLLREELGVRLAEARGRGHLEVPVDVLQAGSLVRDHDDPGLARLLEHGLKRGLVVGDDADHVHAAGDQVLDGADLERRVGRGRADHLGLHTQRRGLLLDALLHRVEPRDAADLDHHAHGGGVLRGHGQGQHRGQGGAGHENGSAVSCVSPPMLRRSSAGVPSLAAAPEPALLTDPAQTFAQTLEHDERPQCNPRQEKSMVGS